MPAASADLLSKLVLSGKSGQEHGQDRLPGGQGDLDPVGWTDLVWNELDQLCEHTQGMEMRFRQAVELLATFVDGRVLPVHKAKEVPRHCSYPVSPDVSRSTGQAHKGG